jgi:hypothetical protein
VRGAFMKKTILILLLPATLLIVGCKRESEYELSTHGGTLYRLDKRSGQISVVEGSKIITLEEQTINITVLSKTKMWHNISLSQVDTVKLSLKTRWRDGNLYFIFTVRFRRQTMLQWYPGVKHFSLKLHDSDGFIIIEKYITSDEMYRLVDEYGTYTGMEINSRIPCTAETYMLIKDWSCGWQLL